MEGVQAGKRKLRLAAAVNVIAAAIDIAAGGQQGSRVLLAEGAHNLGDAAAYGIKAKACDWTAAEQAPKYRRARKAARWLVCSLALGAGLHAGYELLEGDYHKLSSYTAAVAVGTGAANVWVAHGMHKLEGKEGVLADGDDHARSDKWASVITIAATAAASQGIEWADPVGAMAASTLVIRMNLPTARSMNRLMAPTEQTGQ